MYRFLLLLLLVACGSSPKPAPAATPSPAVPASETAEPASRCPATAEKALSLQKVDTKFLALPEDTRPVLRARLARAIAASCSEDAWSSDVLACIENALDVDAFGRCVQMLDAERYQKQVARVSPVWEDVTAAMHEEPEPPPPPAPEPVRGDATRTKGVSSIAACDEYVATFELYAGCKEVPALVIDASRHSLDVLTKLWKPLRSRRASAEKRSALADQCAFVVSGLRQSAHALGCDLEAIAKVKSAKASADYEPPTKPATKK